MAKAKNVRKSEELDVARKIWLAGVGAYGRVFQEAQGQIDKLAERAQDMFEELVNHGEKVEDDVRSRIGKYESVSKVANLVERAQRFGAERRAALEDRVSAVRRTIGETLSAPMNMLTLGVSIEKLTKKVDALASDVAALKKEGRAPRARKAA